MIRPETNEERAQRLIEKQAMGAGCHDESGLVLVDDECDGKIHATTERTCETCWHDGKPCGINMTVHGMSGKCALWESKPRPIDQDADELKPCPFCSLSVDRVPKEKWINQSVPIVSHFSDCPAGGYHRLEDWNRRPSRPMSAEVEKAIETVRECLERYGRKSNFSDDDYGEEQADNALAAIDLIVAVLKEKPIDVSVDAGKV